MLKYTVLFVLANGQIGSFSPLLNRTGALHDTDMIMANLSPFVNNGLFAIGSKSSTSYIIYFILTDAVQNLYFTVTMNFGLAWLIETRKVYSSGWMDLIVWVSLFYLQCMTKNATIDNYIFSPCVIPLSIFISRSHLMNYHQRGGLDCLRPNQVLCPLSGSL